MSENYRPSPTSWVRKHVEKIEAAGTTDVADIQGMPVVLLTMTGRQSGDTLKVPLMRVEDNGVYAAVASKGGAPEHPQWFYNIKAQPDIALQDGTEVSQVRAREIGGEERAQWWERCVAAYPAYAEYQTKTDRLIPVFLLEPR
ncbi:nitroreductase family deazaflavin-dependent oxidoreductase [Blastococcus sp. Marseille-P5729]|uniref:nitroreductase family deazaflavin-dependent oxidoreductase n=1 Tax=Blastococcus sp. Marseille-P5729 TaxID=2086582 RepID=UPI000D0E54D0|nr:nitroreductase family deazaflavin-dependent oxidoreductase [Blastococcus sp. Marseille-P5729]